MKRIHVITVLLLSAAVLSVSCSAVRKCKDPELNLPEQISAGHSDSLTIADVEWWKFYGDTTLCRIIERRPRNVFPLWGSSINRSKNYVRKII